jgi:4-amino-4-deoxy-L-arabinose transferase-like glycosyltransferase
MRRLGLLGIALIALAHAGIYIVYQRPDWQVAWTDQGGYRQLGAVLARTGMFTRYPDAPVFVPEVIRTPGYPAFVAVVYALFGVGNDLAVAIAQALLFAAVCLTVYVLAKRVTSERVALGAAGATALFSPLPYFGALVLTEIFATFVLTIAMWIAVRAVQEKRIVLYAAAGVLFSLTTLVRPAFVLLPFGLAAGMPILARDQRTRRALAGWGVLAIAAALTLMPWFTYNYVYLGRFTLSPAGGIGRGLWEGAWQGRWAGRVQAELTAIADEPISDTELDTHVAAVAARTGNDVQPMLTYVHEWRDIRVIWESPQEPMERARARVVADQVYQRAALAHIEDDPIGHVRRRLTRGLFTLWASEIPIRFTDINAVPPIAIRAIWAVQVLLLVIAAGGLVVLARHGRWTEAVLLALPLLYVTGVHVPLLCEARQSLPVKPLLLVAAAVGVAHLPGLLPLKTQVHERQHV